MTDSPLASAEWLALVAAMRFAPHDDTPRLVAADWFDETGRPELAAWAELIRVQCAGARERRTGHVFTNECDCGPCRAERKGTVLFDRWGYFWVAHAFPDRRFTHLPTAANYRRGFVNTVFCEMRPYRFADVPRFVWPVFERTPLVGAGVQLWRGGEGRTGRPRALAEWVVTANFDPAYMGTGLSIVVTIHQPPDIGINTARAHRVAYKPREVPRMLRGAVAAAIRLRRHAPIESRPRRDTGRLRPSIVPDGGGPGRGIT